MSRFYIRNGTIVTEEAAFPSYRISQLTPEFLNPATRDAQIEKQYLVKIEGK